MSDPLAGGQGTNANQQANQQDQTLGSGSQTQPLCGTGPPAVPAMQASAPIKVMPSDESVREFTSTEADFTAKDFVRLCENVMHNSSITTDVDKINLVCARIKPGSEAFKRMRVSALTKFITRGNYEGFRQRFLKVFGENVKHNLVKGVHLQFFLRPLKQGQGRSGAGSDGDGLWTLQHVSHRVPAPLQYTLVIPPNISPREYCCTLMSPYFGILLPKLFLISELRNQQYIEIFL